MDILENAKRHFKESPPETIDIPEWGDGENSARVFVFKASSRMREKVAKHYEKSNVQGICYTVLYFARTENNQPVFNYKNVNEMLDELDFAVLERVATQIANILNKENENLGKP